MLQPFLTETNYTCSKTDSSQNINLYTKTKPL